jgi:tetratricopeptide (TPR) repeat protein
VPTRTTAAARETQLHTQRRYREGVAAFDRGDYPTAIRVFSEIPANAGVAGTLARFYLGQAHFEAGRQALKRGEHAAAAAHLETSRALNPQASGLSDYLAMSYAGQRDYASAVEALERDGPRADRSVAGTLRLAYAHWRGGNAAQAALLLREAMRRHPLEAEFPFHLALLRADQGGLDEAIELLREATALHPLHADAHRHLGLVLAAAGRMKEAAAALSDARRLRPRDAAMAREHALARAAAREAEPRQLPTGGSFRVSDEMNRAARLGDAFAEEPELIGAFLDLPPAERDAEVFDVVSRAVDDAVARHPRYADLHHFQSRVRLRLGRTKEAVDAADRALAINPAYRDARIHRAELYAALDRADDAAAELDEVIRGGGEDFADVHFKLGELHRRAGRTKQAREAYCRALRLNATYSDARRALEALSAA